MIDRLSSALVDLSHALTPLDGVGGAVEHTRRLATLRERIDARRTLAPGTLVVALAGTTGAGKSSLFNSLAGAEYSRVGVLRPTTSAPTAAIFGSPEAGVGGLLDRLEVTDRHAAPPIGGGDERLVLIDLPDIDSITAANRDVAERLLEVVDVIVWVVDPEKYADSRVHDEFLRPFATLAPVMDVVINQIDRLTPTQTEEAVADLRRRLDEGGITSEVFPISVRTGAGVDHLRSRLRGRAAARSDQMSRLALDARSLAEDLGRAHPFSPEDQRRAFAAIEAFEDEVPDVVGTPRFADTAAREYKHFLQRRTAWPPLRIVHRSRPFPPSAELHTGHLAQPVGRLLVGLDGEGAWPKLLSQTVESERLEQELRGHRVHRVDTDPPGWAGVAGAMGWLTILLLIAAMATFGLEVGVRYFGFTLPPALGAVPADPPYPALPALPWSVVVGAVALVLTALVSGVNMIVRRVSTRRFRTRVSRLVTEDVTRILRDTVTGPLRERVRAGADYHEALTKITRTTADGLMKGA